MFFLLTSIIGIVLGIMIIYIFSYINKRIIAKKDIYDKLNTILTFFYNNNIDEAKKDRKFMDYYLFLNKYDIITIFNRPNFSQEKLKDCYDVCVSKLIKELKYMYEKDYGYSLYSLYSKVYSLNNDINKYKCYKEEMLLISWLLQVYYMKKKTDRSILTEEQSEVLMLIQNEVDKIKNKEIELDKKEKEELFKVFKEQNDKFNNFAKSLYE